MTIVPTTSIAYQLAAHVIDQAEVWLDEVSCSAGWPGDKNITAEMLWLEELTSEVNVPVMTAGRKQRDDMVRITFNARVAGRDDEAEVHGRLAEIIGTLEDRFADDPSLGDFAGIVESEITSHRQTCQSTPEGPVGFAEIVASVHTRLH